MGNIHQLLLAQLLVLLYCIWLIFETKFCGWEKMGEVPSRPLSLFGCSRKRKKDKAWRSERLTTRVAAAETGSAFFWGDCNAGEFGVNTSTPTFVGVTSGRSFPSGTSFSFPLASFSCAVSFGCAGGVLATGGGDSPCSVGAAASMCLENANYKSFLVLVFWLERTVKHGKVLGRPQLLPTDCPGLDSRPTSIKYPTNFVMVSFVIW